jgi:hypothetical protein
MNESERHDLNVDQADPTTFDSIIQALNTPDTDWSSLLDAALMRYPNDGRLLLLQGAHLASLGDAEGARTAFIACTTRSPRLYPGWFMLGFLELMCARVEDAKIAWRALDPLRSDDPLRRCADGLILLVHDEFDRAADLLERALESDTLYSPLNGYIRTILHALKKHADTSVRPADSANSAEQHLLLSGYLSSMTRH